MMRYDNEIVFTLRQHTPHINFQHDQEGATLRATEVKPRLDKYLFELALAGESMDGCRVGKARAKHQALDYKLHFASGIAEDYAKPIIDRNNRKHLLLYSSLHGCIKTEHPALCELIRKNLASFFAVHSFGNRITKGYGCFTLDTIDGSHANFQQSDFEKALKALWGQYYIKTPNLIRRFLETDLIPKLRKSEEQQKKNFAANILAPYVSAMPRNATEKSIDLETIAREIRKRAADRGIPENFIRDCVDRPVAMLSRQGRWILMRQIMDQIGEDYQDLKSGRNRPYRKSLLMEYFCERGIRWEKRWIKKQMADRHPMVYSHIKTQNRGAPPRISDCERINQGGEYKYVRALLGLADHYEYPPFDHQNEHIKVQVKPVSGNGTDSETIGRFASPLLFRVFENAIYMVPRSIPAQILNAQFDFDLDSNIRENGRGRSDMRLGSLSVPAAFELTDFLDHKLKASTHPEFAPTKSVAELLGYKKRE